MSSHFSSVINIFFSRSYFQRFWIFCHFSPLCRVHCFLYALSWCLENQFISIVLSFFYSFSGLFIFLEGIAFMSARMRGHFNCLCVIVSTVCHLGWVVNFRRYVVNFIICDHLNCLIILVMLSSRLHGHFDCAAMWIVSLTWLIYLLDCAGILNDGWSHVCVHHNYLKYPIFFDCYYSPLSHGSCSPFVSIDSLSSFFGSMGFHLSCLCHFMLAFVFLSCPLQLF